jgi:hypothetical protein
VYKNDWLAGAPIPIDPIPIEEIRAVTGYDVGLAREAELAQSPAVTPILQ